MKKFNILICILIGICLFLSGCNGYASTDKLLITATNFAEYDFARAVAGDKAEIKMLIPAGRDMHSFEPTASDIMEIENSDLFIYIGGESDNFVERILSSLDNENLKVLKMSDYVSLCTEHVHTDNKHHYHTEVEYDEHIWLSPNNATNMILAIKDALCEIDKANAEFYTQKADKYIGEIIAEANDTAFIINNARTNLIAVADRNPYRYFTDYYGLQSVAAFAACSEDTDADLKTVLTLIESVKSEKLSAVYVTEMSNKALAETIKENTGAEILTLHSYHNVSTEDFGSGVTYLELMKRNRDALAEGLN